MIWFVRLILASIRGLQRKMASFPIKDYDLLVEHGSPKCARFFETGHMGFTIDTNKIIMNWIYGKLI